VWYRRSFTVPDGWEGQRVLLHFGAVDYSCEVFVNGVSVGKHTGGYDPFSFDVTDKLTQGGAQDLALRVSDETDEKGYPRGKQTLYPGGIMYTATTGIWQTVWLEAVPQSYIDNAFRMIPDIDKGVLKFYVNNSYGMAGSYLSTPKLLFKIYDNGVEIASESKNIATEITLTIPEPVKLWSPDDPFLYDMKIYLTGKVENEIVTVDSVSTYFGMRKISKKLVNGYQRMYLNNKLLFQMGPLDQGFWPDGIYTAPTDEALRFDIEKTIESGFNMTRKHIKVEPYRWYYWCDKLGLLVWQDMPSMNSYIGGGRPVPPQQRSAYSSELERMIKTHWNSPSIVSWVPFNEFQGSHDEKNVVDDIKKWDNTRLVNVNSGGDERYINWTNTDILDNHNYPGPVCPPKNAKNTSIAVCGEYGGIGYYERGHIWEEGNPYATVNSHEALLETYTLYGEALIDYKNSGLSAAVYTEITDVEMELNGLLTYDRKVFKGNIEDFAKVNRRIISERRQYNDLILTSQESGQRWKYTTDRPADSWQNPSFDDSGWGAGVGGFGNSQGPPPGTSVRTNWTTSDIWLRRTFTLPANALDTGALMLKVYYDEDCEVYINGTLVFSVEGYVSSYRSFALPDAAKEALVLGGENTLAVHCHQTTGGQYIDAGLSVMHLLDPSYEEEPEVSDPKPNPNNPNAVDAVRESSCKVYPNPASNTLNIIRKHPSTRIKGIYNVQGVLEQRPSPYDEMVDISGLVDGMYILEVVTGNVRETIMFMKK
jgi:hypothetical protein